MNTNIVRNVKRVDKNYFYISLVLFLLEILLFILIKAKVFKSLDISIKEYLQPDNPDKIPIIIKIFYNLNKIFTPYAIIIIVNNFSDIYNTYNLFNIISIACYISCILKFIFFKIIQDNDNSIIYYCGKGWNCPSTEMMLSVVFYLTLWNIYFVDKDKIYMKKVKKIFKYFFLGIIIIYNIFNLIFLTKIGYYLFSHLVFSAIFGVLIYIFVYETNIIKKYDSNKFCHFIKNKFECYFLVNIILLIIIFIPYIIERRIDSRNPQPCFSLDGEFFHKNKSTYKTYVDDTFSIISIFIGQFFVIIGIKCELGFHFENNIPNFEQYHFGVNLDDLNIEREIKNNNTDTIIVTRDTEWNNTVMYKSIIRLILSFVLAGICLLPYIIIKTDDEVEFSTIFLLKYSLSVALFSLGITFIFKIVFRIFKLTNEILGSILNDQ